MTHARHIWSVSLSLLAAIGAGCGSSHTAASKPVTKAPAAEVQGVNHVAVAEQAVREGDTQRALDEFARAIQVNPNLVVAHMGMADIYRMRGDYNSAERDYAKSASIEPQNFEAQYWDGLMLHLMERLPEAIQAYLRALVIQPGDFKTNLNIATAYYQLDESSQALPYAKRAVELNPQDGPARFNLGAIYAAMNRHADAVREYQQAAEFMQLTPPLLLNLADSLAKLDRYEEMANALTEAIKKAPSAAAYERLGFARFRLGKYEEAKQSFAAALKLDPDYYPALNGLGVSRLNDWIKSGRQEQAARDEGMADLRHSLQINREQPQILEIITRYGR